MWIPCGFHVDSMDSTWNKSVPHGFHVEYGGMVKYCTNDSPHMRKPFAEDRVQEILAKIEIGEDLTEEQKGHVKSLICEYTDVFALSLSEVQFIDWYTHKLHIEPKTKFPTRVNQCLVTEVQKKWFNEILDDMEAAHVIQWVPGDFIKNLSSTNLTPKEARKTGLT